MVGVVCFWACQPLPEKKKPIMTIPKSETAVSSEFAVISEKSNIHYTGLYCNECHERTPVKTGDVNLKFNGDYRLLCRCHHGMSPGYCHPLDIYSDQDKKLSLPSDFPYEDGKFTCNTCHDVYLQCQKSLFKRQSIRGTPYPQKTDFCYRCHDKKKYEKLNAHHQIDQNGKLNTKACLYCHRYKPDEKTATYNEVVFIGDMKALCRRCHQIEGNHAGNFDHMAVKPSAEGLKRMEAMREKYNIILPLTAEGKMTCITCHNPHEKGVIQADKPSAMGADSKFRHRLPGKMCKECHQM
jgi:hypothetical protein